MKIAISCDHRGAHLYRSLIELVEDAGHDIVPVPTCSGPSCDYPDFAYAVGQAVADCRAERGILMCGSGIGMSIAANKVAGVRAALVQDEVSAELCRRHNDANVLCMSADMLGQRLVEKIVEIWLETEFEGGRHARRVAKIAAIEAGEDPLAIVAQS